MLLAPCRGDVGVYVVSVDAFESQLSELRILTPFRRGQCRPRLSDRLAMAMASSRYEPLAHLHELEPCVNSSNCIYADQGERIRLQ